MSGGISFDDCLFEDPRFRELAMDLNNDDNKATGMLVSFWRELRDCDGKMPREYFFNQGYGELVKNGFVNICDDLVSDRGVGKVKFY